MRIDSLVQLKAFAADFIRSHPHGAVVGLGGDLGAGKTTFVRSCIEVLSEKAGVTVPRITSPSFVLHQNYSFVSPPIDHFDLYRLENLTSEILLEMGYFDVREKNQAAQGFVFVEWPERAKKLEWLGLTDRLQFDLENEFRTITCIKR